MVESVNGVAVLEQQAALATFVSHELAGNSVARSEALQFLSRQALGQIGPEQLSPWENSAEPSSTMKDASQIQERYVVFIARPDAAHLTAVRLQLMRAYQTYQPDVDAVLRNDNPRQQQGEYIQAGNEFRVFRVMHDDNAVAVRVPIGRRGGSFEQTERRVEGGLRVQGSDSFPQLRAVSYANGVVVSEFLPGTPLDAMTLDDIRRLSSGNIQSMIAVCREAHERGFIDIVEANLLLKPDGRFAFIDTAMPTDGWHEPPSADITMRDMANMVHDFGVSMRRNGDRLGLDRDDINDTFRSLVERCWSECAATARDANDLVHAKDSFDCAREDFDE